MHNILIVRIHPGRVEAEYSLPPSKDPAKKKFDTLFALKLGVYKSIMHVNMKKDNKLVITFFDVSDGMTARDLPNE